jgi:hypothetical protein
MGLLVASLVAVSALGQVPVVQDLAWDCVKPSYVIVGDVNGDGWDDFVVACHSCNMVLIGLNPTDKECKQPCPVEWPAPRALSLADAPTALAWGLFGSGVGPYEKRIVAVTQYTPGWASFRATDTSAGLSPLPLITAIHAIAGDFNGDGGLDVAVLDPVGLTIHFPVGGIRAISLKGPLTAGQPAFLATADFDRDGDLDLVVASGTSLHFYENTCGGAFTHKLALPVGVSLQGIAIADFDSDGRVDLATVDPAFGALVAIRNLGCWSFEASSRVKLDEEPVFVVPVDADRDGKTDFAVAEYGGNFVTIVRNLGGGRFRLERSVPVGEKPISVAVGDFDRNGVPDLVVALNGGGPGGVGPAIQVVYNPLCTLDDCADTAPCCIPGPPPARHGP